MCRYGFEKKKRERRRKENIEKECSNRIFVIIFYVFVDLVKYNINSKRGRKDRFIEYLDGVLRINYFFFRSCFNFFRVLRVSFFVKFLLIFL